MNFGITVTLSATPELLQVLQILAGMKSTPAAVAAPAPDKKMRAVKDESTIDKVQKLQDQTERTDAAGSTETTPTPSASQVVSGITLEQIRAVLQEKMASGKKNQAKVLLGEFGVDKVTGLDAAQYDDFHAKAIAL